MMSPTLGPVVEYHPNFIADGTSLSDHSSCRYFHVRQSFRKPSRTGWTNSANTNFIAQPKRYMPHDIRHGNQSAYSSWTDIVIGIEQRRNGTQLMEPRMHADPAQMWNLRNDFYISPCFM